MTVAAGKRRRSPRVVTRERAREVKRAMEAIVLMSDGGKLFLPSDQRGPDDGWYRNRRPEEMPENQAGYWRDVFTWAGHAQSRLEEIRATARAEYHRLRAEQEPES